MAKPTSRLLFCFSVVLMILAFIAAGGNRGHARDWSDLDEEEHKIFGSEKEEKYSINAFFIEREKWENHRSLMIFWLYKSTDYPRYTSLRILPFWYRLDSKIDNRRKTIIPLFLYYHRRDGDRHLTLSPLYYTQYDKSSYDRSFIYLFWWGKATGPQSSRSYFLVPPLYRSAFHRERKWYERTSVEEGSTFFSPLWYSKYYLYDHANIVVKNRTTISPLHYYSSKEQKPAGQRTLTWWFPILPLTYHHTHPEGGHRNFLWIFDYSWSRENGRDRLHRFWCVPLLFLGPGAQGYAHILPPVFMRFKREDGEHYTHLLPLFARWKKSEARLIEKESRWDVAYSQGLITPLFGRTKTSVGAGKWDGERYGGSLWFPVVPVFYYSRDRREGSHVNLLWVLDWRTNPDGTFRQFWFFPLVFHQTGPSGYRYYIPFYMRPAGWSEQEGVSWSLVHYHRWAPGEKTRWLLPHYYSVSEKEKTKTNLWFPLYWHNRNPKREYTLFLPLYFSYASPDRKVNFNILGLSKSIAAGPSPVAGVGVGRGEGGWYFDTDISWLYDVVSVSTRITLIKKPVITDLEEGKSPVDKGVSDGTRDRVTLHDKKEGGRENSSYFWGFHFLFGLVAFERADSRRHFRLLPLSWITWDKESADRVQWFLNYLNYRSGETRYFVFFPLYGMQRQGASYRKGYLLNLYWSEYNDTEKLREHTVLWPFVNWYRSPGRSGWRFFPLIWHKKRIAENRETARTISPLYYSGTVTEKEPYRQTRTSLSPFHRYRKVSTDTVDSSTRWFPIIPLVYYSRTESYTIPRIESDKMITTFATRRVKKGAEAASFLFPLYYWSRTENRYGTPERYDRRFSLLGLPLLYYSRVLRTGIEPGVQGRPYRRQETSFFLMGYYRHTEPGYYHSNLLLGLYWYTRETNNNSRSLTLLYGIFHASRSDEKEGYFSEGKYRRRPVAVRSSWLFPLYYSRHRHSPENDNFSKKVFLTPLWCRVKTEWGGNDSKGRLTFWAPVIPLVYYHRTPDRRHFNLLGIVDRSVDETVYTPHRRFWLLPLYYHRESPYSTTSFIAGLYLHSSTYYKRQNFLLLYDHRLRTNTNEESYGALLGLARYEVSPQLKRFRLAYGLLLNYKSHRNGPDYSVNVLWFLYSQKRSGDYFRTSFMPLWYYGRDSEGWDLCLPPLLTYMNDRGDRGKFQMWALGALWYRNYRPQEERDRRALLLGIPYYHVEKPERGYSSTGSLWGLLWEYETESDTNFTKFSLLKFLYKRVNMNGEVSHRVMGIRF